MNARFTSQQDMPSAIARAQAAAWFARLHGPNCTPEVEAGLRRWLEDDPERAAAFELVTDTWRKSARLRRRTPEEILSWKQSGLRLSFLRAVTADMAIGVLAVLGTLSYLQNAALTTEKESQAFFNQHPFSPVDRNAPRPTAEASTSLLTFSYPTALPSDRRTRERQRGRNTGREQEPGT